MNHHRYTVPEGMKTRLYCIYRGRAEKAMSKYALTKKDGEVWYQMSQITMEHAEYDGLVTVRGF